METVSFRGLADELNVRVSFLSQLARAGKLQTVGNRILKESADELRWHLAVQRHLLGDTDSSG